MSQYRKRTDGNHAEFAAAFKRLGYPYKDVHGFAGMLDFMVSTRRKRLVWFEVKSGPDEPLTKAEEKTFAMFPGNCYRVDTVQQAIDILCEVDEEGD